MSTERERKTQVYNGKFFHTYSHADGTWGPWPHYFKRSLSRPPHLYLHRCVYEDAYGPIPEGRQVHHKDGNWENNHPDNLIALSPAAHTRHHYNESPERREKARVHFNDVRPLAVAWHRSEEGRVWHRQHGKNVAFDRPLVDTVCIWCGDSFRVRDVDRAKSLFCNNAHKSAYRRHTGVDDIQANCAWCGKLYARSRYSHHTCCTRSCGQLLGWSKAKLATA